MAGNRFVETAPSSPETIERVLGEISGARIQKHLGELALIGGAQVGLTPEGPIYSVNRLAFSEEDRIARGFLEKLMTDAEMRVEHYAFGVLGTLSPSSAGNEQNPAVMLMSHYDSVPNAGAFDGCYGVIGAIEVTRALNKTSVELSRPVQVLALTAEESSRFNLALVGSKIAFDGLTEEELGAQRPGDKTIQEAVGDFGYNPQAIASPTFSPTELMAVIELHIEQNDGLINQGKDLGIVDVISAPDRREIYVGEPLTPDTNDYPNQQYLQIVTSGKPDHSGATPMGKDFRADGFLPMSDMLINLSLFCQKLQSAGKDVSVSLSGVNIPDQALNKIPGKTSCLLKIGGSDLEAVQQIIDYLGSISGSRNRYYQEQPVFDQPVISVTPIEKTDRLSQTAQFYKADEMLRSQLLAGQVVKAVNNLAKLHSGEKIVGTVATYTIKNGKIILGVDIRGTEKERIAQVWQEVREKINRMNHADTTLVVKKLPASAGPAKMDERLRELLRQAIEESNIGSWITTLSPAGQDSQITARKGIPTAMIFIPSLGGSHNPNERSSPKALEKGAKALAALVLKLASVESKHL